MASKIGGYDNSTATGAIGGGRAVQRPQDAASGGAQSSGGSTGSSSESVQITGVARQLSSLEQAIRDLPAVNDAKVAQLSNAIEQGSYSVNSQHIADRLIQTGRELSRVPDGSDTDSDADAE